MKEIQDIKDEKKYRSADDCVILRNYGENEINNNATSYEETNIIAQSVMEADSSLNNNIDSFNDANKIMNDVLETVKLCTGIYIDYKKIVDITTKSLEIQILAQKVLNALKTPKVLGLVVAAAAACTVAFVSLTKSTKDEISESEALAKSYGDSKEEMLDYAKANEELQKSRDKQLSAGLVEIEHLSKLSDEMSDLSLKSGDLTDSDILRAEFITGQLNEALGTEYEALKLLKGGYKDVELAVEDLILTEKARVIMDHKSEGYKDALENKKNEIEELNTLLLKQANVEQSIAEKEKEFLVAKMDWIEEFDLNATEGNINAATNKKIEGIDSELDILKAQLEDGNVGLETAKSNINKTLSTIFEYETATGHMYAGDSQAVIDSFGLIIDDITTASDLANLLEEEKTEILGDQYLERTLFLENYAIEYTAGTKGYTQIGLDEAILYAEQSKTEYEKVAKNSVDGFVNGININKYKASDAVKLMMEETNNAANGLFDKSKSSGGTSNSSTIYSILPKQPVLLKENRLNPFDSITSRTAHDLIAYSNNEINGINSGINRHFNIEASSLSSFGTQPITIEQNNTFNQPISRPSDVSRMLEKQSKQLLKGRI